MDAMYRRKRQSASSAASVESRKQKRHASDEYDSKVRPRETHPDSVDSKKRIKGNLNHLNKRLVEAPVAVVEETDAIATREDRGERVETQTVAAKSRAPVSFILSLLLVVVAMLYVVSLFAQVNEYTRSIDEMENRIAELKEQSTRLEVQLESRYDLDEVERIATQEYGMVVSSTLPKKYISISSEEDLWQKAEKTEPEVSFWEQILSGIRTIFGVNEE